MTSGVPARTIALDGTLDIRDCFDTILGCCLCCTVLVGEIIVGVAESQRSERGAPIRRALTPTPRCAYIKLKVLHSSSVHN